MENDSHIQQSLTLEDYSTSNNTVTVTDTGTLLLALPLLFFMIIGTITNLWLIWVRASKKGLYSTNDLLIGNVTFANVILSAVACPLILVEFLIEPASREICLLGHGLVHFAVNAMSWSFVPISVNSIWRVDIHRKMPDELRKERLAAQVITAAIWIIQVSSNRPIHASFI